MTQIAYLPNLPSEIDIRDDREKEIDQRNNQVKLLREEITNYTIGFIDGQIDSNMLRLLALTKIRTLENTLERIRILESM